MRRMPATTSREKATPEIATPAFTVAEVAALTEKERDVLGWIYITRDEGHPPGVILSLLKKGWIVPYKENVYGTGDSPIDRIPMEITRYTYPCVAAHMAWCQWCSENVPEEDL